MTEIICGNNILVVMIELGGGDAIGSHTIATKTMLQHQLNNVNVITL